MNEDFGTSPLEKAFPRWPASLSPHCGAWQSVKSKEYCPYFTAIRPMTALPSMATIARTSAHGRFVPVGDLSRCSKIGRAITAHSANPPMTRRVGANGHRLETEAIRSALIKLPELDQQSVPLIGLRRPLQAHLGYHIPKARQDRAY